MVEVLKKKRGRKPKSFNIINNNDKIIIDNIITEEENIIYHLPLTTTDLNNNLLYEDNNTENCDNIFLKNVNNIESKNISDTQEVINNSLINIENNNINKITTHNINSYENCKCWWCKNNFDNSPVQLPESYFNNIFYCIGNFCSFNCVKSYNLDLNDSNTYKRESLINLLYYMTYNKFVDIKPAPHWITLIEYGGILSIEEYRLNFINNKKEYLLLIPPLISRQIQIEESYKINKIKEVHIDNINKIYSDIDSEYNIKRNKPILNSKLNLEATIGLVRFKRK